MRGDHGDRRADGAARFESVWSFDPQCDQHLYHYGFQPARRHRHGRCCGNHDRDYYKSFLRSDHLSVRILRISCRFAE